MWIPAADAPRRPRADRLFRDYTSVLPPRIAGCTPRLGGQTQVSVGAATAAVAQVDTTAEFNLAAISGVLLRSEAVASSKIEHIRTNQAELVAVLAGAAGSRAARDVAANVGVVTRLVAEADSGVITEAMLLRAHRDLLGDDPFEGRYAGAYRPVQNWIGGSDYSPRDAVHVPPDHKHLPFLMKDLLEFANRTDLPPIVQAAVAHAQFEVIHPFTDGNGRVGRGLIHAILRARGLTSRAVVPIAMALLVDLDGYFSAISAYGNEGEVDRFVQLFADAAVRASVESIATIEELAALPDRWRGLVRPSRNSVLDRVCGLLIEHPSITTADAMVLTGATRPSAQAAIDRLEAADVLGESTGQRRNRRWTATEVLDAVDDLEDRLGRRTAPRR